MVRPTLRLSSRRVPPHVQSTRSPLNPVEPEVFSSKILVDKKFCPGIIPDVAPESSEATPCLNQPSPLIGTQPFTPVAAKRRLENLHMKYAIIQSGGKQYRCEEGGAIEVDRLPLEDGTAHTLQEVL